MAKPKQSTADFSPESLDIFQYPPMGGVSLAPSGLNPLQAYDQAMEEEKQAIINRRAASLAGGRYPISTREIAAQLERPKRADYNLSQQKAIAEAPVGAYEATPQDYGRVVNPPPPVQESGTPEPPPGPQLTSQTITSQRLPEDVEAMKNEALRRHSQYIMQQATAIGDQARAARDSGKAISMQMAAVQAARTRGIDGLEEYMTTLAGAYEQADADLASMRVDPSRWEKETPVLAQVLLAVAAGAAGFANQGRGPNPIVQLIERAIDRDVQVQRDKISLKLKRSKNKIDAAQQMGLAQTALTAAYMDRALDGISEIQMRSKSENLAYSLEAVKNELLVKDVEAQINNYNNYAQTTQSTYKATSGAEGGRWDDAVTGRAVINNPSGVQDIGALYEQWKSARVGNFTTLSRASEVAGKVGEFTGLGSTAMSDYEKQKSSKVLAIAAEYNKGRPTDKDFQAVAGLLPTSGISQDAAAQRTGRLLSRHFEQLDSSFQSMSSADKAKAAMAYKDALQKTVEVISKNPELMSGVEGKLKKLLENVKK